MLKILQNKKKTIRVKLYCELTVPERKVFFFGKIKLSNLQFKFLLNEKHNVKRLGDMNAITTICDRSCAFKNPFTYKLIVIQVL